MEFYLNGREIQWIQGIWLITEAWIGVNLKILSLTCVLLVLCENSKLKTQNSKLKTQNSKLKT